MEKMYAYNEDSCAYEEVEKPFMMHNMLLLALMFTSFVFFLLTCYYHAENEKTMALAPGVAKNCYAEVENLKTELLKQRTNLQIIANHKYLLKNASLDGAGPVIIQNTEKQSYQLTYK
jgi:hypothetical protein